MDIEIIPCLNDNYSYLLKDNQTDTVAIIDPSEFGPCDKKINQNIKNWTSFLTLIIILTMSEVMLNLKKNMVQKYWVLRMIKKGSQK